MHDKDSLDRGLSNAQMEQIQSLYNMDKLVLKREQQQEKIHYFVLIDIGIAQLALIAFVIHMYFSRKRLQKDEKEVARLSEIAIADYLTGNMLSLLMWECGLKRAM